MNTLFKSTLFIAYIATINLASSIGIPANADVVTDWNNAALDAIRAGNTAPPIASRSLAILHASIYDAVNGIARSHEQYLVQSAVSASASREAAASAAAHQALVNLFPASISSFDALHAAILATIQTDRKRLPVSCGVNLSRTKSWPRARMMVPAPLSRHLEGVVRTCGCRLLRRFFLICCRNGDSLCRLE